MVNTEHVEFADEAGNFYCRAVNGKINYRTDKQFSCEGCPCNSNGTDQPVEKLGKVVCFYTGGEGMFPAVNGISEKVQRAFEFAANAHKGQTRKGTKIPYITHLITTYGYCSRLLEDEGITDDDVLVGAILHDTVEDAEVTVEDIDLIFGERVAELVSHVTEDKRNDQPATATWEIRKQETLEHLMEMPLESKMIALSDKTANAVTMVREYEEVGDELWKKFNQQDKKKQEWYYRGAVKALSEFAGTSVYEELCGYIDRIFG